jgi:hypothetical protein
MGTVKLANETRRQENSTHHRQWYCSISLPCRAAQRGGDSGDEALLLRQSTHRYRDREHLDLQHYRSDERVGFKVKRRGRERSYAYIDDSSRIIEDIPSLAALGSTSTEKR